MVNHKAHISNRRLLVHNTFAVDGFRTVTANQRLARRKIVINLRTRSHIAEEREFFPSGIKSLLKSSS